MDINYENTQEYFLREYNSYLEAAQAGKNSDSTFYTDKHYQGMNLHGLHFEHINFSSIEFTNCSFYNCDFSIVGFFNCKFNGNITFRRCTFNGLTLDNCYFQSTIFSNCSFRHLCLYVNSFGDSIFCYNRFDTINSKYSGLDCIEKNRESFINSAFISNHFFGDCSILTSSVLGLEPICPEEGSFIGFKQGYFGEVKTDGFVLVDMLKPVLIKLLIPEDAKRSSANTRKCRCDKAKVLAITSLDGKEEYSVAKSIYASDYIYKVGEMVVADSFNENWWEECSNGIHFFLTKQEAINY